MSTVPCFRKPTARARHWRRSLGWRPWTRGRRRTEQPWPSAPARSGWPRTCFSGEVDGNLAEPRRGPASSASIGRLALIESKEWVPHFSSSRPCCVLLDSWKPVPSEARPPLPDSPAGNPERLCNLTITVSPLAGKPADPSSLVNAPGLITAYYTDWPDSSVAAQRVAFGTSGHRGSSLKRAFNERHILAISQAICL